MLWNPELDKPKVLDEVGKALMKVAGYIDEHGWCQHTMKDYHGKVCLSTAISDLFITGIIAKDIISGVCETIEKHLTGKANGTWIMGTVKWNDAPERTKEEVTGLLRKLAYQER